MILAERLSLKPTFLNFSRYRDEMIGRGIEVCIIYFDNFDPNKSTNPFAYFTQIMKFAFVDRLKKEKKQHYIKIKNMERLYNIEQLDNYDKFSTGNDNLDNDITNSFVQSFEDDLAKKKAGIKSENVWLKKLENKGKIIINTNTNIRTESNSITVNTTIIFSGNNIISTNTIISLDKYGKTL